jgi:diadenosine tetraphosphate (Ap4A) HIT family hydrolase
MAESDDAVNQYPEDCPFCTNAAAYPAPPETLWGTSLSSCIPEKVDVAQTSPSCFLVLSAPRVMAFLDILPMTQGHLLVVVRDHRPKVEHMEAEESRDVGFWLPLLAKAVKNVTGTSDYNIVQNNGTEDYACAKKT